MTAAIATFPFPTFVLERTRKAKEDRNQDYSNSVGYARATLLNKIENGFEIDGHQDTTNLPGIARAYATTSIKLGFDP